MIDWNQSTFIARSKYGSTPQSRYRQAFKNLIPSHHNNKRNQPIDDGFCDSPISEKWQKRRRKGSLKDSQNQKKTKNLRTCRHFAWSSLVLRSVSVLPIALSHLFFHHTSFLYFFPPAVLGMVSFYTIPGLIASDAGGNPFVNAFYCSVMTLTT